MYRSTLRYRVEHHAFAVQNVRALQVLLRISRPHRRPRKQRTERKQHQEEQEKCKTRPPYPPHTDRISQLSLRLFHQPDLEYFGPAFAGDLAGRAPHRTRFRSARRSALDPPGSGRPASAAPPSRSSPSPCRSSGRSAPPGPSSTHSRRSHPSPTPVRSTARPAFRCRSPESTRSPAASLRVPGEDLRRPVVEVELFRVRGERPAFPLCSGRVPFC